MRAVNHIAFVYTGAAPVGSASLNIEYVINQDNLASVAEFLRGPSVYDQQSPVAIQNRQLRIRSLPNGISGFACERCLRRRTGRLYTAALPMYEDPLLKRVSL